MMFIPEKSSMGICGRRSVVLGLAGCLFLTSCQGLSGQNNQGSPNYAGACVGGAALGAGGSLAWDLWKNVQGANKSGSSKSRVSGPTSESLKRAGIIGAAGCAVGLAVTGIGQILNEREQKRQEEVFQQAARDGATQAEQARQQVADRYKSLPPPATEPERSVREQEKVREMDDAANKEQAAKAWAEGTTSGKAVYIGSVPSSAAQAGQTSHCAKIREVVTKDGKEVMQVSTACMGENGEYQRVDVKPA